MIILNFGLPRSGTILVNGIVREILKIKEQTFAPHNVQQKDVAPMLSDLLQQPQNAPWPLLHMHYWDPAITQIYQKAPERFLCLCNVRDPRDCAVSLAVQHEITVQSAAGIIARFNPVLRAYYYSTKPVLIRYDKLIVQRAPFIAQLGERLGVALRAEDVAQIEAATSIEKAKSRADAVAQGAVATLEHQGRARVMAEDADTHISDKHIQSGKPGRWRSDCDDATRKMLISTLGKMAQDLGYGDD